MTPRGEPGPPAEPDGHPALDRLDELGRQDGLDGLARTALLPLALADLHAALPVGAVVDTTFSGDDPDLVDLVVEGSGFGQGDHDGTASQRTVSLTRRFTLADTVGPDMGLLLVGLNPSRYAAEAGVGFARPGNRFWPAAIAAGIVSRDRDPRHALVEHGVGMTDLVKRATVAASELEPDEYRAGLARLDALVAWLAPDAVCFIGLAGWRTAVDRRAQPGRQARALGDRPVYVMPNTSGLNAHGRPADFVTHLRAAANLAS